MDYQLRGDEVILLQHEGSSHNLLLTNLNIIVLGKNFWGKIKDVTYFNLQDIKQFNQIPQVKIPDRNGTCIEIQFKQSVQKFELYDKRVAIKWKNNIVHLVSGDISELDTADKGNFIIPGADLVADALKDTFNVFKRTLEGKGNNGEVEHVSENCVNCGATISGIKGQVATCEYCGNKIKL